jgi:hypothetical protein
MELSAISFQQSAREETGPHGLDLNKIHFNPSRVAEKLKADG